MRMMRRATLWRLHGALELRQEDEVDVLAIPVGHVMLSSYADLDLPCTASQRPPRVLFSFMDLVLLILRCQHSPNFGSIRDL